MLLTGTSLSGGGKGRLCGLQLFWDSTMEALTCSLQGIWDHFVQGYPTARRWRIEKTHLLLKHLGFKWYVSLLLTFQWRELITSFPYLLPHMQQGLSRYGFRIMWPVQHRAPHLEGFHVWFNALLLPSWNS